MGRKSKLGDRSVRHDAAYERAKAEGFAGRAIYKLEELDRKFKLMGSGRRVLDLGCWPGSWLQYAAQRVSEDGLVVGLDLKPVEIGLPPQVTTAVADVEGLNPQVLLDRFGLFDLVLSDMAPHTTGDRTGDQHRSEALFGEALRIARGVLRPGGHFAAKIFQGGQFKAQLEEVRKAFQEARPYRAKHTRKTSIEQYIVGRGYKSEQKPGLGVT